MSDKVANVSLNRRIPRKANDPRPAMPVAARAPNIIECNADGRVGVAALHGEIEVDHRAARVARDDEPVVLPRERGANCRPEPFSLLCG